MSAFFNIMFGKVLNPLWWFDVTVIKPLMFLLSAIFWLPLKLCKFLWRKTLEAWNSKFMNRFKPKSLLGKIIVYPILMWCAFPGTNTWLFLKLVEYSGIGWTDVMGFAWDVTSTVSGYASTALTWANGLV